MNLQEIERRALFNSILISMIIFMIIPLSYRMFDFKLIPLLANLIILTGLILISHFNKKSLNTSLYIHIFISFIFITLAVSSYSLGNENFAIIWFYLIPLFSFLLLNSSTSLIYTFLTLVMFNYIYFYFLESRETELEYRINSFYLLLVFILYKFSKSRQNGWAEANNLILKLNEKIEDRTRDLINNYDNALSSLAHLLEQRDSYTAGHSRRVSEYAYKIGQELNFDKEDLNLLKKAGLLHDIGKLITPDNILLKPSALLTNEFEIIQQHPGVAFELLSNIPMYKDIAEIILYHHERFDGTGYPDGKQGDEIPNLSQVLSVADAFDAMTTNRIYKPRKSKQEALSELQNQAGKQFNPDIVIAATKALSYLDIEDSVNQTSLDGFEQERFNYFYKDKLTNTFNLDYLKYFIQLKHMPSSTKVSIIKVNNFSNYNKQHGWEQGDKTLINLVKIINERNLNNLLFRVHGDDFVVIQNKPLTLDDINNIKTVFMKDSGLELTVDTTTFFNLEYELEYI